MTRLRRFDIAEDSLQDAFLAAARTWPEQGVPDHPAAWLLTTAHRRTLDRIRREENDRRRLPLLVTDAVPEDSDPDAIADERLRLLFACCHPALSADARAALMLRFGAGLKTVEIARLFLVQETTMARRITRAKAKIKAAHIPYQVPSADDIRERLAGVLAVVYLVFNEGYLASEGDDPVRVDLTDEAIRLGRLLRTLLPDDGEVVGLLALILLTDARRACPAPGSW